MKDQGPRIKYFLPRSFGVGEQAEGQGLSPEERLRFHWKHSQPVMDTLDAWFETQFAEKRVEPNSGLGEAIACCLKRWGRLTLSLCEAGVPLDSNIVERALKKAILHRIELQKHPEELAKHPADWMPWNYRQALQQAGTSQPPA